jgi:uncharacterized membrane protein YedE/YeeE
MNPRRHFPPVLSGMLIGISMLLAFVIAGRGIGVSGMLTRLVATVQHMFLPATTENNTYFGHFFVHVTHPLNNYLSYLLVGILAGAFIGSLLYRDFGFVVQRGPRISALGRLVYALIGGIICGFAARMARGCASGQGLVGGAELSVGSWTFLLCMFIGGFATAWFVRKQWI